MGKICVPAFVINEINHKTIPKIVTDYLENKRKPILEWPPHHSHGACFKVN